eukprot:TRINITY_DN17297_c0_g1_i5.p1 TRINITY_DN17297_c0_g1~~TRINITY_DN17297_c0_g1_i5.p1  ORF type:complete len:483 (-),score=63.51 TRINITY_DN17297_c0_g1_i5:298-1746(-)
MNPQQLQTPQFQCSQLRELIFLCQCCCRNQRNIQFSSARYILEMMQEEDSVSQQNVQQNISNRPESPLEEDDSIQESGINKIQSEKQIKTIQHKSNSYSIDGGEDSKREIHLAAVKGDEKYMRDIIQRGGNLHVQTKKGETALHLAARYDHDLIVNDLMLNGGVSSIKDKNGQTPLHVACANGAHGAAKVLLNFQADLTVKDKDGMAPLHLAAKYNKPQIIEIVGRRKGDLQIRVPHNMQAPIHVAVEHGSQAAMEALVAHGANPNLRAWSGQSPLHVAVEHGQSQLIAPLIARGAVINQRLTNGRSTPLTLAIDKDQLECIKELLKVAQEAGKLQEILGQRARDAHMWLPIHVAVYSGKREAVKLLVAAGADLQTQDYYRFSCLHLAAECDDPQMVKLLLSYGVDVNEHRLTDNWSALHQAAAFCSHNAAEALLEAGAKPNVLTCGVMFGFMRQRPIHVVGHNCRDQRKIIAMRALLQKYE